MNKQSVLKRQHGYNFFKIKLVSRIILIGLGAIHIKHGYYVFVFKNRDYNF